MSLIFASHSFTQTSSYYIESGGMSSSLQSGSYIISDVEVIGSLDTDFSTNTISFTILSQSAGGNDNIIALTISGSGDAPLVGLGTTDPLSSFDIRSITSSDPANIILRTNEDGVIQVGEETGKVIFAIESASYLGTDFISSGSTAAIFSKVLGSSLNGAYGSLTFEVNDDSNVTQPIEAMTIGYGLGPSSTDVGFVLSGSIRTTAGANVLSMKSDISNQELVRLGYVTSDVPELDRGSLMLKDDGDIKVLFNWSSADYLNTGNNFGIGTTTPESKLHVIGDIKAIGDIIATGDIIAQRYIVSSSVSHITSSFSSGSTVFGDTLDDTHQFTGSVNITGSFTAAGLTYPTTDGDDGNIVMTDGAGGLTLQPNTAFFNVKNIHGSTLLKGTPVHATGTTGNTSEVIAASASNAPSMPATYVLAEDLNHEEEGRAILTGYLNGINTSNGFTEGDVLYVGENGGYTPNKPIGSNLIQNIGIIIKTDAVNGSILIYGSGRSNDVPNLLENQIFFGSGSDQTYQTHISSALDSTVVNNITASGDISSSGTVTSFSGSIDHLLVNNKLQGNGPGFQFFSYNEDTVKTKFANWYSSNDHQYGMGMLWYETWFGALEDTDLGNDKERRIGFYLETPEAGATDSISGETGRHPNNARFYVDITGSYVASGGLHVTDANFNVESDGNVEVNGNITVTGNVDGRDVSADGSKLDGIEAGADVTDTANVTAAGALMDSEITSLSLIKGITAAQISGAFDAASASLASDIPTNNNQLTNGAGYATGDNFDEDGTYASLRAQGTTAGDVGLGSSDDVTFNTVTATSFEGDVLSSGNGDITINPGGTGNIILQAADIDIKHSGLGAGSINFFELGNAQRTKLQASTVSSDITISLPNTAGTLALTDDIPSDSSISGSFNDASASFSTRVTTIEDAGYTTNTGTVDTSGTPANNQLAIFTDSNTIEGTSELTYNGTTLNIDGLLDMDGDPGAAGSLVDINNTRNGGLTGNTYALRVRGGDTQYFGGTSYVAYGGYFEAGTTTAATTGHDTIALYAQAEGYNDAGDPYSYAAIFSGSGGTVGINTMQPTVELDVVGDISASGNLSIGGIPNVSASIAAAGGGGGSDNLGNHTATQDLDLNSNSIKGITHITASGNISASGIIVPQYDTKIHTFFTSDAAGDLIPMGGTLNESTTPQYYLSYLSPYGGQLIRAYVMTTSSATGDFTLSLRRYTGFSTFTTIATATGTINSSYTPTLATFSAHTINAGDWLAIHFAPTGTPSGVNVTTLWRMDSI